MSNQDRTATPAASLSHIDVKMEGISMPEFVEMGIPLTQVAPIDCGLPLVFPEVE